MELTRYFKRQPKIRAKLAATRQSIQWQNEYPDRSTDHKARNNSL